MASEPTRWLIGVDPAPSNVGALRLARWLHERTEGRHELHGAHAVSRAAVGLHNRLGAGPDTGATEAAVREFLAEHDVGDAMHGIDVRVGAPERVLPAIMDEVDHVALVVGRRTPTVASSMTSLGRVGRRLLHRIRWPLVVVPANLPSQMLGQGPLVIAVDPSESCMGAIRFGQWLGRELALPVMLVHAIPPRSPVASLGVLEVAPHDPVMAASDIVDPEDTSQEEAALERWLGEQGLLELPLAIRRGPVAAALYEIGRETTATMLLCGTRRASLVDRLQAASVGIELTAHADRPVAVIPREVRSYSTSRSM